MVGRLTGEALGLAGGGAVVAVQHSTTRGQTRRVLVVTTHLFETGEHADAINFFWNEQLLPLTEK